MSLLAMKRGRIVTLTELELVELLREFTAKGLTEEIEKLKKRIEELENAQRRVKK